MTHLGVDLARTPQRPYKTDDEKAQHHRRLHRLASFTAQILCPIAPLFALPALTEKFYVKKNVAGLIVAVKSDPPLIIAAGAVTLALACLSNLTILFRLIDTHCVSSCSISLKLFEDRGFSSRSLGRSESSPLRLSVSSSRTSSSVSCPASYSVSRLAQ